MFAADLARDVGMAAPGVVAAAVHRSERGCGDGGEHQGVLGHGLRDGLAAGDAGVDQVIGVAGVEPGAGRAHIGATVPAAHVGDPEWLLA